VGDTRPIVFLAYPGKDAAGGGMYRVAGDLFDAFSRMPRGPAVEMLETRGGFSVFASPFFMLDAAWRLYRARRTGRTVLLHVNMGDRLSWLRKAILIRFARRLGAHTVIHLHASRLERFHERLPGSLMTWSRGSFQAADACIALGRASRDWLVDTMGVAPERLHVVANGVPPVRGPRPAFRADDVFRIVFVGLLGARKGVNVLLNALASSRFQTERIECTLIGGGDLTGHRRLAESLGIAPRLRFTGWQDRDVVYAAMLSSDVLVLPSFHENLPLVVLEAMSAGLPVICTDVGQTSEHIASEEGVLYVEPGRPECIVDALDRIRNDPALAERLSRAGRAAYEARFSMDAFARRILDVYRGIGFIPSECR
jgi:glycosyltransferase involved in cell wall biosynthesis